MLFSLCCNALVSQAGIEPVRKTRFINTAPRHAGSQSPTGMYLKICASNRDRTRARSALRHYRPGACRFAIANRH